MYQNCVAQEARQDQQGDDIEFARRSIHGERTQPPKQGYVPSEALAVALARAVLNPLYGEEAMAKEEPFNARFAQGIWTVIGTFNGKGFGGVAIVQLQQSNGEILFVSHSLLIAIRACGDPATATDLLLIIRLEALRPDLPQWCGGPADSLPVPLQRPV